MVKFKTIRVQDFRELDAKLNAFDLGNIIDYQLTMPDYRVVIVVLRYRDESDEGKATLYGEPVGKKAKDDKPAA